MKHIDLTSIHSIHFAGIKGIAMTALAIVARQKGYIVTGSDVADSFPSDESLKTLDVTVHESYSEGTVGKYRPDLLIYTGAHNGRDNPEVVEAVRLGIPVLPHGKALGLFMDGSMQLSVAGCHGKTTTSAMVATIAVLSDADPSYAIGCGSIRPIGLPGHAGDGKLFIAEADEYVTDPGHDKTPRFLWQTPNILIITNIEYDHPDAYTSLRDIQHAYVQLAARVKGNGKILLNGDDRNSDCIRRSENTVTVGMDKNCTYQITDVVFSEGTVGFSLREKDFTGHTFTLSVPGKHNVYNAAMAAVAAHLAGIGWDRIEKSLHAFTGTKRRFEIKCETKDFIFIDDYAHHPSEISATIDSAKLWFPHYKITVVFQPHTYSRTKALMNEFGHAFEHADTVIISDIYASKRESDTLGITGSSVVQEISKFHDYAYFGKDTKQIADLIRTRHSGKEVVLFMGAGDIYNWEQEIIDLCP